jgi:hypothetical protein
MKRWTGLKDLVQDAIDQGSTAVEQVHQQVARTTFDILEYVPPLAEPARRARLLQEAVIGGAYDAIRLVNRMVGVVAGAVMDAVEPAPPTSGKSAAEARAPSCACASRGTDPRARSPG